MESLPALMNATDMLVCGEDLGMVPDCVHPVLKELGLLGKMLLFFTDILNMCIYLNMKSM